MIILPLQEVRRKDFLDEKGIPTTHVEALAEVDRPNSLIPVCLLTYPLFGIVAICLTKEDFEWASIQRAKQDWYLLDIGDIKEDSPQLIASIEFARRTK